MKCAIEMCSNRTVVEVRGVQCVCGDGRRFGLSGRRGGEARKFNWVLHAIFLQLVFVKIGIDNCI